MTIEELLAQLQAIIDGAVGEEGAARDLTEEEAQRYEQLEKQLAVARRSAEIRARQTAYTTPTALLTPVAPARPDNTLERAFEHYLRTGKENQDLVQLRAQSEGTGTEGGYLVPDGFRNKIVDRMVEFGGLANHVETVTTSTGNNLPWITMDDTANVGEIVAEGGTFSSGADLVFGTASLGAYTYAAGGASALPLRVSWELLQDAAVDIEGLVSKKLGERIARLQATHWISGNGVQQPLGIVYGLTGTEVSSALAYADLVDAIHRVDPAYREGAKWSFNDGALASIRKLVDGDNRPLLQPAGNGIAGSPGGETLLGYPVVVDQAFDDLTLTSGAGINWGVFGRLSEAYVIRRVKDVTLVVNPWSRAANRQTEFSAWARADGTRQNTNAYTVLAGYTA